MARAGANVAAAIAIVPFSTYRLTTRPPTRCSRVVVCCVERAPSPAATLPPVGANPHFSKYFEKYAMIAREENFPEIYHTHDRILLFVSALYGFRVFH